MIDHTHLLPCPFCEAAGALLKVTNEEYASCVVCTRCEMKGPRADMAPSNRYAIPPLERGQFSSRRWAIAAWNALPRAEDDLK